jgi:ribonuclease Z
MTTKVIITGTGTPQVSAERAGPGVLVQYSDDRGVSTNIQIDAGSMTLGRLAAADVLPAQLDAIFLTHYHSDHLVGLADVLLSHWVMDRFDDNPRVPLIAPNGSTTRFLDRMFDIWDHDLAVRALHNGRTPHPKADVVGFDVPAAPTEVWSRGYVTVVAGQVRHEPVVGAVGYRIETPDGVVAISGDTTVCPEVASLATGADVLVYEAMRTEEIRTRPQHLHYIIDYHADTREIGQQAAELGVSQLMLTHLIPQPRSEADKQLFADDVREGGYRGELLVCDDLDSVTLG